MRNHRRIRLSIAQYRLDNTYPESAARTGLIPPRLYDKNQFLSDFVQWRVGVADAPCISIKYSELGSVWIERYWKACWSNVRIPPGDIYETLNSDAPFVIVTSVDRRGLLNTRIEGNISITKPDQCHDSANIRHMDWDDTSKWWWHADMFTAFWWVMAELLTRWSSMYQCRICKELF